MPELDGDTLYRWSRRAAAHFAYGNPMILTHLDDLTSECAEAGLRALPRYDPGFGASLHTFLTNRMNGACLDYWRDYIDPLSRRHRQLVQEGELTAPVVLPIDADPLVRQAVHEVPCVEEGYADVEDDRPEVLDRALAALPARLRTVVERHLRGEKLQDIAVDLQVTPSRVSQLRNEALALMRQAVCPGV